MPPEGQVDLAGGKGMALDPLLLLPASERSSGLAFFFAAVGGSTCRGGTWGGVETGGDVVTCGPERTCWREPVERTSRGGYFFFPDPTRGLSLDHVVVEPHHLTNSTLSFILLMRPFTLAAVMKAVLEGSPEDLGLFDLPHLSLLLFPNFQYGFGFVKFEQVISYLRHFINRFVDFL